MWGTDMTTTVTTKSGVAGRADANAKNDKTGRGSGSIQANRSVTRSDKLDNGTRDVTVYGKADLGGSLERDKTGWKNGQDLELTAGRGERSVLTDKTGATTTHVLIHEGTLAAGRTSKHGETKAGGQVGLDLSRRQETLVERSGADGTYTAKSGMESKANVGYTSKNGFGIGG